MHIEASCHGIMALPSYCVVYTLYNLDSSATIFWWFLEGDMWLLGSGYKPKCKVATIGYNPK
jgi:hypothetical protein